MAEKTFKITDGYIHIPIKSGSTEEGYYVEILADGELKSELLLGIAAADEKYDFYVPFDTGRYKAESITFRCNEKHAKDNMFDGFVFGGAPKDEKGLYPDLYKEKLRQQLHFSPQRGWLNDPNGLFYKDGVFHMYFQHNQYGNHHFGTNVSWGHGKTEDGIHFEQCRDAIIPRNSRYHIASGSAVVDEHNVAGMGKNAVLAAYTDLMTDQHHGRSYVDKACGQRVMYSLDDGASFEYLDSDDAPAIKAEGCEYWRDPKILQIDEKTLCIAVYETYEGQNCISFYSSDDCRKWTFRSRTMNFYECPDIFKLKVKNADEYLWVVYGAEGKYQIGHFENFEFSPLEAEGYIDHGDSVYAGQTFNNYVDETKRIYTAWLRDHDMGWGYEENEPNKMYGFSQSMAIFTELSLVKTKDGYRVFRTPIKALDSLCKEGERVDIGSKLISDTPCQLVFTLERGKDARIQLDRAWFAYDAEQDVVETSSGKRYTPSCEGDLSVRVVMDTRSAEVYLANEMTMSFFTREKSIEVQAEYEIEAVRCEMESIW